MLYKVPQKIDLEDKVIGPLTFRQFLYLLGGILPAFIIAKLLETYAGLNLIVGLLLMFPLWLPAIFLAFAKFQEQNVDKIVLAMFNFISIPKTLIWNKKYIPPKVLIKTPKKEHISYSRPKSLESRLQSLSESLSIYGVKPQTNEEQDRVVVKHAQNLVIKTKIKPVSAVPNQEREQVADAELKEMQKEFGLTAVEQTAKSQSPQVKQTEKKNDIMEKNEE
ncbi:MAG: PrgI family protein [Patescibacteria group bacterium]|nr:PrgI family protein [Patescibacteria group bacterium]